MEEMEDPTESVQDKIHEQAHHSRERWISRVALSSAILAALAAVSALLSGHHANEAMIEQLRASDHWAQYQAKSIKATIISTRQNNEEKLKEYEKEQKEIAKDAQGEETSSRAHLATHQTFAKAVTFFQIAIAIGAIAALTKRRRFWWVSLGSGTVGLAFLISGLLLHQV